MKPSSILATFSSRNLLFKYTRPTMSVVEKQAHSTAINSFNLNHQDYDAFRPSFLKELVDPFLVQLGLGQYDSVTNKYKFDTTKTIVEIAAGTGKFTRNLVDNGFDNQNEINPDNLIIVEPSQGMLTSFKKNFPQIQSKNVYQASSYKIPLDDNTADSIIIAQGFHWFSDQDSLKEISRVLKPHGTLGLIWNFDYQSNSQDTPIEKAKFFNGGSHYFNSIDFSQYPHGTSAEVAFKDYFDKQPWSEKVCELIYNYDLGVPQYRHGKWRQSLSESESKHFHPIAQELFALYDKLIKKEDVYPYWETRSYITELSDSEKKNVKDQINQIIKDSITKESTPFTDKGDDRLLKPMATHAVVVPVKK
ncbi:methyltransferase [Scheffersomyces amazonensis]|uniref:methyltransferase n=1 Tax=Scheffersomyces amazonensis TaxID=1078765 RepID=UPI00315D71CA